MNLLLDTHVALWAITDDAKLSEKARLLISEPKSNVWVSVVSLWEIAIKHSLGRGDMPVSSQVAFNYFKQAGFQILPIEADHTVAIESLSTHHQDPFDRLLVAQALTEPMHLITHDENVAKYSKSIIYI